MGPAPSLRVFSIKMVGKRLVTGTDYQNQAGSIIAI
jgi:hypothetical protein